MELRLQLLETLMATGSDGASYKLCAYDRLAHDPAFADGDHWLSTGTIEYRLADGRRVDVDRDGSAHIAGSGVRLTMPQTAGTNS
jgi:hypothetical protein